MLQLPESDSALFEGIFDAIAAGTFLYVAVFEILADEFKDAQQVTWKSIAMSAGIALMAVVAIWT
jgi:zinc transporter 1/2/3